MDKLPRVRKGDPITAAAWNDVVDKVNGKPDLSIKRGHLVKRGDDVRLARLQSAWQQNAAGVWYATACFIVNDVADTSSIVAVYAPVSNSNPGGTVAETRFYVVWRGRWELLGAPASNSQPPQTTLETVLTNIAGEGVGWIGVLSQSSGAVATKVCHAVTVNQGGLMFDFVPTEIATVSNKTIRVFA